MAGSDDGLLLEVLRANRAEAISLSTEIGRKKLSKLLARAEADLIRRLDARAGPQLKKTFTISQMQTTLAQVRDVTRVLAKGLGGLVVENGTKAADASTEHLLSYLNAAEKRFKGLSARPLNLKEVAILDAARSGTESTILRRLASDGKPTEDGSPAPRAKIGILQRYGLEVVGRFEESMQVGLLARKSWGEMREDLVSDSPFLQQAPAHWAERILRTETIAAYNRGGYEGMQAAQEQLGDCVRILCAVFDERTGWDSYQVHGEIRRTSEPFQSAFGSTLAPPNRPNDRETVIMHRTSWPIPATLRWRSQSEVQARWTAEGRKGSAPPRTWEMTTVPLSSFPSAR